MNTTVRCQSCGMPLGEGFFGMQADGSPSSEYCKFCFQDGRFTDPALTLDGMIRNSIDHMTRQLKIPPERAAELAHSVIPSLGRWRAATPLPSREGPGEGRCE